MSKRRSRRRIFSREFKLSAIERMLGGESTRALARELGVDPKHLHQWCHRFRMGGAEGVRQAGRPRKPVVSEEERAKTRATDLASARKYIAELEAKMASNKWTSIFFGKPCGGSPVRTSHNTNGGPVGFVSNRPEMPDSSLVPSGEKASAYTEPFVRIVRSCRPLVR